MTDPLNTFCIVATIGMLLVHVIAYWPSKE